MPQPPAPGENNPVNIPNMVNPRPERETAPVLNDPPQDPLGGSEGGHHVLGWALKHSAGVIRRIKENNRDPFLEGLGIERDLLADLYLAARAPVR